MMMVADVDGVVAVEDREEDDNNTMRNDHLWYDDVPLRPKKMLSIATMSVALFELASALLLLGDEATSDDALTICLHLNPAMVIASLVPQPRSERTERILLRHHSPTI